MSIDEHKAAEVKRLSRIALSNKTDDGDNDWYSIEERCAAIGALRNIHCPETLPALYRIAEKSKFRAVVDEALTKIGYIHDEMNRINNDYSWYGVEED